MGIKHWQGCKNRALHIRVLKLLF